jgi:hypothetical protein
VQAFLRVHLLSQATTLAAGGDTARLGALADSLAREGARTLLARPRGQHNYVRGLLFAARGDVAEAQRSFEAALKPVNTDYSLENARRRLERMGRDTVTFTNVLSSGNHRSFPGDNNGTFLHDDA